MKRIQQRPGSPKSYRACFDMSKDPNQYREILPASASLEKSSAKGSSGLASSPPRSTRLPNTLVACDQCRKKKCKCDGRRPVCLACEATNRACRYDAEPDAPRSVTLKRKYDLLEEETAKLRELYALLKSRPEPEAMVVFQRLRMARDLPTVLDSMHGGELLVQSSVTLPSERSPSTSSMAGLETGAVHAIVRLRQLLIDTAADGKFGGDIEAPRFAESMPVADLYGSVHRPQ